MKFFVGMEVFGMMVFCFVLHADEPVAGTQTNNFVSTRITKNFDLSKSPGDWLRSQPILKAMLETGEKYQYKSHSPGDNCLWVFRPEGLKKDELRPCVLYIHGGAWGGNAQMCAPQCIYLARKGIVGISVEFRRNGDPRICLADCLSAYRWVKKNDAEINVDPSKIVLSGGSAGGHLALSMVTLTGYDDPQDDLSIPIDPKALILYNPAIDLVEGWEGGREICKRNKIDPASFSPAQHVKVGLPETIIISGGLDNVITPKQIRDFQKRMEAKGNICTFYEYPEVGHGAFNYGWDKVGSAYFLKAMGHVETFLKKLGYLQE